MILRHPGYEQVSYKAQSTAGVQERTRLGLVDCKDEKVKKGSLENWNGHALALLKKSSKSKFSSCGFFVYASEMSPRKTL